MELQYKRATPEDLDLLAETRITVLRAANRLDDNLDLSALLAASWEYYRTALAEGSHVAYLVLENGQFVGAGGVSFYRVMPTYHNPSGQNAYIMNLYTAPSHRRQGIATHTLELLITAARERGVKRISLDATQMGRPLYEKYGFVPMPDEMELPFYKF